MSTINRREALSLVLGGPLAAAACRRQPPPRVDGEVVGASEKVGHVLRALGDAVVEKAVPGPERFDVVVVGAGVSGLSAARHLVREGVNRLVVFDLEAHAGGTATSGAHGVVPHPWGAHYVPTPGPDNAALAELFDELGLWEDRSKRLVREEYRVRAPDERLFVNGSWQSGLFPGDGADPEDRAELERFFGEVNRWVAFRDALGRRAFTIPMQHGSDDPRVTALDKLSAEAWLEERGYRSGRLRWFLELATRDDYGLLLRQTSAWALLFYFASRRLKPGGDSAPFVTFPEGNGRLTRHLASVVGSRLRLGHLVTDAVPHEDFVELAVLDVAQSRLQRVRARQVIFAAPQLVARRVLRPYRESPPPYAREFSYGAWLVANLHLKMRPPSAQGTAWDNVLYDSPSLGYVSATHQALRDRGRALWTYYLPLTSDDPAEDRRKLSALGHGEIVDAVLTDLSRPHPDLGEFVERVDVCKWGHAMIRPTPGFVWGPSRRRAAEPLGGGPVPRVHFGHSDLSGVALFEEAQARGIFAAYAALEGLRSSPTEGT